MVEKTFDQEILDEIVAESKDDILKEDRSGVKPGKKQGILAIVLGVIGLAMPWGFQALLGATGLGLAIYANKHDFRKLAIFGSILGIFNLLGLLIFGIKF